MISEFFNLRGRKSFFNRNFFIVLAIDVVLLSLSWFAAYWGRFDLDIPEKFVDEMFAILPVAILIKLGCFYIFGVYRGMWRFTGVTDLFSIIKAVSLSMLLIIVWALLIYRYKNVPRSVVFIDWCFKILRGIHWTVRCVAAGNPQGVVASSERFLGSGEWRAFSMELAVDGSCRGQVLQLEPAGREGAVAFVSGVAWFDEISVCRR